jgi:hypothetical protein
MCAVSAMGWSTIMAPSNAQDSPPRERQTFVLSSVEQPFCVNLSIAVVISVLSAQAEARGYQKVVLLTPDS